jgi:hypothetical protein
MICNELLSGIVFCYRAGMSSIGKCDRQFGMRIRIAKDCKIQVCSTDGFVFSAWTEPGFIRAGAKDYFLPIEEAKSLASWIRGKKISQASVCSHTLTVVQQTKIGQLISSFAVKLLTRSEAKERDCVFPESVSQVVIDAKPEGESEMNASTFLLSMVLRAFAECGAKERVSIRTGTNTLGGIVVVSTKIPQAFVILMPMREDNPPNFTPPKV